MLYEVDAPILERYNRFLIKHFPTQKHKVSLETFCKVDDKVNSGILMVVDELQRQLG